MAWSAEHPDAHREGAPLATYYRAMRLAGVTLDNVEELRADSERYRRRLRRALRRLRREG